MPVLLSMPKKKKDKKKDCTLFHFTCFEHEGSPKGKFSDDLNAHNKHVQLYT